jgi:16S rRNA G527 N7-methylase RsmG
VLAERVAQDPTMHEQFDVAFSRAAAPPARLVTLALPLVAPGGALVAAVRNPVDAAAQCRDAARVAGGDTPVAHATCVVVRKLSAV